MWRWQLLRSAGLLHTHTNKKTNIKTNKPTTKSHLGVGNCLLWNSFTTWVCVQHSAGRLHWSILLWEPLSLWIRGCFITQGCSLAPQGLTVTKNPFIASQPDCNRLCAKRHFFLSHWWARRLLQHPTNVLLCKTKEVTVKTKVFICAELRIYCCCVDCPGSLNSQE